MTSIEDRLRDLGRTVTLPPLPGATAVKHRARQRRRRRRTGVAAVLVVAGTGAGVAGGALRHEDGPTVRLAPGTPADDGGDGWIEVPAGPPDSSTGGWDEVPPTSQPTSPTCTDPATSPNPSEPGDLAVPDVTGLSAADARRTLEDLGFAVQVLGNGNEDARVLAQDPTSGSLAPVGTTISLEVG